MNTPSTGAGDPMHILIILNDPPYGTERSYNGLRLAKALGREEARVTLFLMADAVVCANRGQKVPQGFYNVELMLNSVIRKGEVLLCGSCMDARGVSDDDLVAGARRSSMKVLGEKTLTADKVLVF
ncbi:MAG: DsrE family protein [Candidatus Thiodiazotropha endolucinida]